MTLRPRIAIPLPTSTDPEYNERCWRQYAEAIEQSGGTAVMIELAQEPAEIARQAASCNGVLLPGSPADVHPQKYGQTPHPKTASRDVQREAADELLLQDAFNLHKPLLGICYGHQSMNVWKGGTLVQHLQTSVDHMPGRAVEDAHRVLLAESARHLRAAYGSSTPQVNSSHHQAVHTAGDGLLVAAHVAEDGVLEAVEADQGFIVGVQWHPERTFASQVGSRRLFSDFVQAAANWRMPNSDGPDPESKPGSPSISRQQLLRSQCGEVCSREHVNFSLGESSISPSVSTEQRLQQLLQTLQQPLLSADQAHLFADYLHLLLRWNTKLNLSSIRDSDGVLRRHFVESIICARLLPQGIRTLLDYGSGGGFPGVPCAICRPEVHVTLAESQAKKAAFLREVARTLHLNANVSYGRVESMPATAVYDAVTLRAVDRMPEACTRALLHVKAGGWLAIFATHETVGALIKGLSGVHWREPYPLPRSDQELLMLGRHVGADG